MSSGAHSPKSRRAAPTRRRPGGSATGRSRATAAKPATSPRPAAGPKATARRPAPAKGSTRASPSPARRRGRPSRRVPLAVGVIVAVTVIGTSFPASALLGQHRQLSAAQAKLAEVQHQDALLTEQEHQLNDKTEIQRLARQNYQLVQPGQLLFNVLPADGSPTPGTSGATSLGDPADQPLVSPADAPDMTPDPGNPTSGTAGTSGVTSAPVSSGASSSASSSASTATTTPPSGGGFWHRVRSTLEFWR